MTVGPIQFTGSVGAGAWAALGGVLLGIVALYFLKLRRRPVTVPSTLLWRRSMEDLHVNSLFQRLRRNLLLFLQLLAILLVMLALAGPRVKGTVRAGARFVLAVDNSASMAATDVKPSRLDRAKAEARKVLEAMQGDDLAMIISFSDRARVVSNYTADRSTLLRRLDAIEPTQTSTSLREALQVAAGLANPSKAPEGVEANSMASPQLKIYTDGGFADVEGFSLGNLEPEVIVLGAPSPRVEASNAARERARAGPPSNNVAILALQSRQDEEKPDIHQVFGRVHNYRGEPVDVEAKLFRADPAKPSDPGSLVDAVAVPIAAQADASFQFDLTLAAEGLARGQAFAVSIDEPDDLPLDNKAFALIAPPRKAKVLAVSSGNRYLADTLKTPLSSEIADVTVATPDEAKAEPIRRDLAAGRFDLVILDRVRLDAPPEANTLTFGEHPTRPADAPAPREVANPTILDVNSAHPLMQYIRDLPIVRIARATVVEPPKGSSILIEGDSGPLGYVTPRGGFSDAVIAFPLLDGANFNTDWMTKYSFPLFLLNALQTLGNARESADDELHAPGQAIELRVDGTPDKLTIGDPGGQASPSIPRSHRGTYDFAGASTTGIYRASWTPGGSKLFVVNEFDPRESDLAPRGLVPEGTPPDKVEEFKIKIGYNPINGTRRSVEGPVDYWKPIAVVALLVVCLEWYVYNRRVHL